MIEINRIDYTDWQYGKVLELRNEVLRIPLGLSIYDDDLAKDRISTILAASKDEEVVGCLLLEPIEPDVLRLRAMAVSPDHQKTGVGRTLVKEAENVAVKEGAWKIVLHARDTAIGFYEKLGYACVGEPFTEVGLPHRRMQKEFE